MSAQTPVCRVPHPPRISPISKVPVLFLIILRCNLKHFHEWSGILINQDDTGGGCGVTKDRQGCFI